MENITNALILANSLVTTWDQNRIIAAGVAEYCANARLIAAAPELLAECERVQDDKRESAV